VATSRSPAAQTNLGHATAWSENAGDTRRPACEGSSAPSKDKGTKPVEDRIKPGDRLTIRARNALANEPIDGPFDVEASGKVALGPTYGRVKIDGLTLEEAEEVLLKHLKNVLRDPIVSVARYNPPEGRALELRVLQLELEVKQLKLIVNELRNKKP
jgi:protein involved in polysaccharide export with SLBB domain